MSETYLPSNIAAYLSKRAAVEPWRINEAPSRCFSGAVVIPSLAEAANLSQTLESLTHNPADLLDRFIILVVVNQRADASGAETVDNLETLKMLPLWKQCYGLKNPVGPVENYPPNRVSAWHARSVSIWLSRFSITRVTTRS